MRMKGKMSNSISKVTFSELLSKIPYNNFDWYIFEIEAVGVAPMGMSMPEFEEFVLKSSYGYNISWSELLSLSEAIYDINNLILVATTNPVDFESLEKSPSTLKIKLEIFDSSYWELIFYENFSQ